MYKLTFLVPEQVRKYNRTKSQAKTNDRIKDVTFYIVAQLTSRIRTPCQLLGRQGSKMFICGFVLVLCVFNIDAIVQNVSCPVVTPKELDWKEVSRIINYTKTNVILNVI